MRPYFLLLVMLSLAACSSDDDSKETRDSGVDDPSGDGDSGDGDSGDGDSGDGDAGDGNSGDGDSADAGSGDGDSGDGDSGDGDSGDGDSGDGGTPPGRCEGQSYTTAPSGAPCDVLRFTFRSCAGPGVGQFCDTLGVTIGENDEVLEGFTCEQAFDGLRHCAWTFAEGNHTLDEAAIEAACAQTVAEPPREVECVIYE